jgi:serine/threonine-protein kinase
VLQNPPADAVVKHGRRIYLTVSGGEVEVTVPSLRGRSLRDARFALERNGLTLGSIGHDTSALYPANTVMTQSIPPNQKATKGSVVSVTISKGGLLPECVVPNVVGVILSEAERQLAAAGVSPGKISYQPSADLLPNTVIDQYPRAGETVARGHAVDLFVTRAGTPVDEIPLPGN